MRVGEIKPFQTRQVQDKVVPNTGCTTQGRSKRRWEPGTQFQLPTATPLRRRQTL